MVLMDQSAQNVAAPNLRRGHVPRVQSGIGRLKVEASMRPGPVVVLDEGAEHALQVTPSEDEDVVEALPTNGAYPALRERVRLRRPDGVFTTASPSVRRTSSKPPENLASRSRTRMCLS
jgi:hypothetical protein